MVYGKMPFNKAAAAAGNRAEAVDYTLRRFKTKFAGNSGKSNLSIFLDEQRGGTAEGRQAIIQQLKGNPAFTCVHRLANDRLRDVADYKNSTLVYLNNGLVDKLAIVPEQFLKASHLNPVNENLELNPIEVAIQKIMSLCHPLHVIIGDRMRAGKSCEFGGDIPTCAQKCLTQVMGEFLKDTKAERLLVICSNDMRDHIDIFTIKISKRVNFEFLYTENLEDVDIIRAIARSIRHRDQRLVEEAIWMVELMEASESGRLTDGLDDTMNAIRDKNVAKVLLSENKSLSNVGWGQVNQVKQSKINIICDRVTKAQGRLHIMHSFMAKWLDEKYDGVVAIRKR